MGKILKVGEVDEMKANELEKMMTEQEKSRMYALGFETIEQLLDKMKDDVVLSGLEEYDAFSTISDYLESLAMKQNNEVQEEETQMIAPANTGIMSFDQHRATSRTKKSVMTNIKDRKKIFNLGNHVDKLLNDCEGQVLTIKEALIKRYDKPMDRPIYDEETGELIKDTETTYSCVLVDSEGTSYATGSKVFTIDLINCIEEFGQDILDEGLKIKIIKQCRGDNKNKSLVFELM